MSGHKPKGRLAKVFDKKNTILVSAIVDGKETIFARIEANLGPQFRIVAFDNDAERVINALAISRKAKHHLRIEVNDIVILSTLPKEGEVGEIMGRIERKDARPLYKDGRIHEIIYTPAQLFGQSPMKEALDDIFEGDEEAEAEDRPSDRDIAGERARERAKRSKPFNIDNI